MSIRQFAKVSTASLAALFFFACRGLPPTQSVQDSAPQVVMVAPQANGVATNREIAVIFSKPMNPASINTGTFVVAGVAGTVTYDSVNKIGAFKPLLDLAPNTTYNASITTGATDLNGTPLAAPFNFSFTTRATTDTSPPYVVAVNVAAGATCVPLDTEIQVTFSEPIDSLTLTPSTFFIEGVAGDVTYDAATVLATFKPAAILAANTTYTIVVTTGVKDMGSVPLTSPFQSTFTTGPCNNSFFTTFDAPGSIQNYVSGINLAGAITGDYVDARNVYHGFLRAADGTITTFDPPESLNTFPRSINETGAITGYYGDATFATHGFLRAADGTITTFDPPGSTDTIPRSINEGDAITGFYGDAIGTHGFLRAADGTITTFDITADHPPGSIDTEATSINLVGAITGTYNDASGTTHGFLRAADGTIATFDPPGSLQTYVSGINEGGATTGDYVDAGNVHHGFLRAADSTITTFDPPGSIETQPLSINESGAITGDYVDSGNVDHGFLRAADGTITPFDPPGSKYTFPQSINEAGAIAGFYGDVSFTTHGFLRSP